MNHYGMTTFAGVLGAALLCVIHGATVENTLFADGDVANTFRLSAVAHVFTIKSDHGLSEAGYDKIVEWARELLCCKVHDETPQFKIPEN